MSQIIVGNDVINRASTQSAGNTVIDINVPAPLSGVLTSVQIWSASSANGTNYVGVFRLVSGSTYRCIDGQLIGSITSGAVRTFVVNLQIQAGDFIGIYYSSGSIERTASGNILTVSGNKVIQGNESSYSGGTGILSIKGAGYTYDVDFDSDVEYEIGIQPEDNLGIVDVDVDGESMTTPTSKLVESGENIVLKAPPKWQGRTFTKWRIFGISSSYDDENNEITLKITEELEARAVYIKEMFFEDVEHYTGPIFPLTSDITEFESDVSHEILSYPTYEDFTTYTKVDPLLPAPNDLSAYVTLTANFLQWRIPSKKECTVYYDFGVDYFDGDFQILFKLYCDSTTPLGSPSYLITLSNAIKTMYNLLADDEDFLTIEFTKSGTNAALKIQQNIGGTLTSDFILVSMNTFYGVRFIRNETTGKLTMNIYNQGIDPYYVYPIFSLELGLGDNIDFRYLMVATGLAAPTGDSNFNSCNKGQIEILGLIL